MKTRSNLSKIAKLSAVVACTAFVAIVGAAVTTHAAAPVATPLAADQVVRLDPVTVTMSRARFDTLHAQSANETTFARKDENRALKHG